MNHQVLNMLFHNKLFKAPLLTDGWLGLAGAWVAGSGPELRQNLVCFFLCSHLAWGGGAGSGAKLRASLAGFPPLRSHLVQQGGAPKRCWICKGSVATQPHLKPINVCCTTHLGWSPTTTLVPTTPWVSSLATAPMSSLASVIPKTRTK